MRFAMEPQPGDENFSQWCDAIKVANRMSGGVPNFIRRKVGSWIMLSFELIWQRQVLYGPNTSVTDLAESRGQLLPGNWRWLEGAAALGIQRQKQSRWQWARHTNRERSPSHRLQYFLRIWQRPGKGSAQTSSSWLRQVEQRDRILPGVQHHRRADTRCCGKKRRGGLENHDFPCR